MGKLSGIHANRLFNRKISILSIAIFVILVVSTIALYSRIINKQENTNFENSIINVLKTNANKEQLARLELYEVQKLINDGSYDKAIDKLNSIDKTTLGEEKLTQLTLYASIYGRQNNLVSLSKVADEILKSEYVKDPELRELWQDTKDKADAGINVYAELLKKTETQESR